MKTAGNREKVMRDPVTGFEYPSTWVTICKNPELLGLVSRGLAVLASDGTVLRRGYTTGSTAAAACKSAVLSLLAPTSSVVITTPSGVILEIPVKVSGVGIAECSKFAGDYPEDVTAGITFRAVAKPAASGIVVHAGSGIGRFTRDTPRYSAGEPAISPHSMACIRNSISEALGLTGLPGVAIDLDVPGGELVAEQTLNPRLGIVGGISVLGTTGLVEPWDDHLEETVLTRVRASRHIVLTTGRTGLKYARMFFPAHETILIGNKIGTALGAADGEVILFGLPGLILRYINPGVLDGTGCRTVEELVTTGLHDAAVTSSIGNYRTRYPGLRIILIGRDGTVTHDSAGLLPDKKV